MSGVLSDKNIDDIFFERYTYKLSDKEKNIIRDTDEYKIFSKSYNWSRLSMIYGINLSEE